MLEAWKAGDIETGVYGVMTRVRLAARPWAVISPLIPAASQ